MKVKNSTKNARKEFVVLENKSEVEVIDTPSQVVTTETITTEVVIDKQ